MKENTKMTLATAAGMGVMLIGMMGISIVGYYAGNLVGKAAIAVANKTLNSGENKDEE